MPYYVAHEYARSGVAPFQFSSTDAVWEGIGEGWAFSPSGGAVFQGTTASIGKDAHTFDNADTTILDVSSGRTVKQTVNPFGVVVESVFNGTFEHGNLHRGQRFPSNEIETPGWSLHGGGFQSDIGILSGFTVHEDVAGNYVAELNSGSNAQITHNRFYIPETAQSLEFYARVESKEFFRAGRLTASISLNGTDFQLIGSFDLTATSSQYTKYTFSINSTSLGNVSGKTGYIRFELTHPGGGPQSGIDRVYIDDVRLLGVGVPLQTESVGATTGRASSQITQVDITSLIGTARSQWQGLVQAPEGRGGVALGQIGITATNFSLEKVSGAWTGDSEQNGYARGSEGGFNDQLFITDSHTSLSMDVVFGQEAATIGTGISADQLGLDNNVSLTSHSHAIDSQPDAGLSDKSSGVGVGIVNKSASVETNIVVDESTVGDSAIGVVHFNVGFNAAVPGSERTVPEFNVLNAEKVSLPRFQLSPSLVIHEDGIVSPPPPLQCCTRLEPGESK